MEKVSFSMNDSNPLSYTSPSMPNWQSSTGMDVQLGEFNCNSEQLPSCFLNPKWENSMDQSVPFESALSSIVSSPAASNATVPTESVVIRELIGRLGSVYNSGEISPSSQTIGGNGTSYIGGNNSSTKTSCYSTPLNSPAKLNLSMINHQVIGNLPIPGNSLASRPSLAPFSADPGFAERAAKFSCFSNRNLGGLLRQFGFPDAELPYRSALRAETRKLSRVSSSQCLVGGSQMSVFESRDVALPEGFEAEMQSPSISERKFNRSSRPSTPDNVEFSNTLEESSISGQNTGGEPVSKVPSEINGRKRKATPKSKPKDLPASPPAKDGKAVEDVDSNAKRCKVAETTSSGEEGVKQNQEENSIAKAGEGAQKQSKENSNPPEPPKDYIHVRARRGQATDSHSLAERVRREKISERMKFLQDLVPGCNKVTGKAVMLDEIINYVQSLQRQVEFLSMKLATVNPRLDFNMETLLSKDICQSHGPLSNTMYPLDSSASTFPYVQRPQPGPLAGIVSNGFETHTVNPLDPTLHCGLNMQLPTIDGYADASSQLMGFWGDDLQSVVQMGSGQSQETALPLQNFHGPLPTGHMKIEL